MNPSRARKPYSRHATITISSTHLHQFFIVVLRRTYSLEYYQPDVIFAIRTSLSKQCATDPLSTWLLKECTRRRRGSITQIFNLLLIEGHFPVPWKHAIVMPLLKKAGMDDSNVSSYRPVSNILHLSKILERIVHRQLIDHLEEFKLLPDIQSTYRNGHSTETAVLMVYSDPIDAISTGKLALLSLLYLMAAFDTVDHAILLRRLETTFGFCGTTLKWQLSYLEGRTQSVHLNGRSTDPRRVVVGVPQGSVLGPLLLMLYTADIGKVISKYDLSHHIYADDNQL